MAQTTSGVFSGSLIWLFIHAFLLSRVSGDFTSEHLSKYLDKSVSPCADFHGHVCSVGMNLKEGAIHKSNIYYMQEIQRAMNMNNPIMNDIVTALLDIRKCNFNAEYYVFNLRTRCGTLFKCYLDEFYYFHNVYKKSGNKYEDTLAYFASHANKTRNNIPKIVTTTSEMVAKMVREVDESGFMTVVNPYLYLHTRLAILSDIEYQGSHISAEKFYGVERIRNLVFNIKKSIEKRFMETSWLNQTDSFGFDRLSQYLTTLRNLRIVSDFDKSDANTTIWRRFDRIITEMYFVNSRRSTGCARFDVMHPFLALVNDIETKKEPRVKLVEFERYKDGLTYNAFNVAQQDSIIINAPTFFPFMWANSSDITQLGFTAAILGHEIFHSFIRRDNTNDEFREEAGCLLAKFEHFCGVWAKGACNSGDQTITEDGPDLEALRAAYDLLLSKYTIEQLQEYEYQGLNITRQQAFFYAYAIHKCGHGDETLPEHNGVHSRSNIRLNGAVGLMPEFTEAFQCQKGDPEYSEEDASCYIFGPLAGTERGDPSSEEDEDEDGDDGSGDESLDDEDETTWNASI